MSTDQSAQDSADEYLRRVDAEQARIVAYFADEPYLAIREAEIEGKWHEDLFAAIGKVFSDDATIGDCAKLRIATKEYARLKARHDVRLEMYAEGCEFDLERV